MSLAVRAPTAEPCPGDGAVVAQHLQREQAVVQRRAGGAAGEQGRGGGDEQDEIGFLAGQEGADSVGDAHDSRAAGGGEMEGAEGIEAGPAELADLVGLAERVEDLKAGAGADVGADAEPDAVPVGLREIEQAGAEEQVAGRAEGDARSRLGHARQRPVAHVDAMGEN